MTASNSPLYLVSCVGRKALKASPAADLYRSDWFRKARAYVEALGVDWRILSAEHGILRPDQVVEPYDRTLNGMSKEARQVWAERVVEQLRAEALEPGRPVVILAGSRYRHPLLVDWLSLSHPVSVPMAGLGIGQQKAWLADQVRRLG